MSDLAEKFPFVVGGSIALTAVGSAVSSTLRTPTDSDFLVQHLDFTLFDDAGAVDESLAARNEVQVTVANATSGEVYFNQATDVFVLRRYCRSLAFRPFVLPRRTELEITATISTYVNAGDFVGAVTGYKLNYALVGTKIK